MGRRAYFSFLAFVLAFAMILLVLGWFVLGFMEYASRPLVPKGAPANVDLVIRSMQMAFQFSAFLFTGISLIVALLGFLGFRSLMDRTQESLQSTLTKQIDTVFDKAASTHTWRAESHLSGRLGWLLWRVSETTKDFSLLDIAIVDTIKGLRKMDLVENRTQRDIAGIAILKNNLAYYYAQRFKIKASEEDRKKALEFAAGALDSYNTYLGKETEMEIPYAAEEFAETKLMVLASCDPSPKSQLQIERICEVLREDLEGKPEKAAWLSKVLQKYQEAVSEGDSEEDSTAGR